MRRVLGPRGAGGGAGAGGGDGLVPAADSGVEASAERVPGPERVRVPEAETGTVVVRGLLWEQGVRGGVGEGGGAWRRREGRAARIGRSVAVGVDSGYREWRAVADSRRPYPTWFPWSWSFSRLPAVSDRFEPQGPTRCRARVRCLRSRCHPLPSPRPPPWPCWRRAQRRWRPFGPRSTRPMLSTLRVSSRSRARAI